MKDGRPLRFLGVTLGSWIALRTAMLWPVAGPVPALIRAIAPPLSAEPSAVVGRETRSEPLVAIPWKAARSDAPSRAAPVPLEVPNAPTPRFHAFAGQPSVGERGWSPMPQAAPVQPPPLAPPPLARSPARLAGSAWLIAREGRGAVRPGGQLGGSQAGARITYALGEARRVAVAVRMSAPLAGRGAEAAIGLDWQPTSLPVHVVAEQRFGLDGAKGGATLFVVGGVDPTPVAAGFRLEAYGQAGAIARDGGQMFADGAARLMRPAARHGALRLDLGVGTWGGAQPGAARLDVGPSVALAVPVGGRAVRMTLDWRQRIAGDAAPGSGPALSIGGDF